MSHIALVFITITFWTKLLLLLLVVLFMKYTNKIMLIDVLFILINSRITIQNHHIHYTYLHLEVGRYIYILFYSSKFNE